MDEAQAGVEREELRKALFSLVMLAAVNRELRKALGNPGDIPAPPVGPMPGGPGLPGMEGEGGQQKSKAEVRYRPAQTPDHACGSCAYFSGPGGLGELLAGPGGGPGGPPPPAGMGEPPMMGKSYGMPRSTMLARMGIEPMLKRDGPLGGPGVPIPGGGPGGPGAPGSPGGEPPPHPQQGTCALVTGAIRPDGVCDLFEPHPQQGAVHKAVVLDAFLTVGLERLRKADLCHTEAKETETTTTGEEEPKTRRPPGERKKKPKARVLKALRGR